ncbi:hypothetical protein DRB17_05300 [Ferruginivarius sediminum]|uniref:PAS domain-containing protein n=2 Tax=Ferruginivarius sediminum TaxID=2661937 RepID=A0A369TEB3_9PROT|nr:hypothetical protein DRB17_05300 [Ferruginivarius sediminum]
MAYWDDLRGDREYPPPGEVDPNVIGDDWPNCAMLEIADPLADSRFHHVGAELLHGKQVPDEFRLRDCPQDTLLHYLTDYLSRTLDKGVPMSLGGEGKVVSGDLLYRSILLPLSSDGTQIDYVLGAANGRLVTGDDS